jgi:hypothetical protein
MIASCVNCAQTQPVAKISNTIQQATASGQMETQYKLLEVLGKGTFGHVSIIVLR